MNDSRTTPPQAPGHSLWPIGFAIGIACILVGLVDQLAGDARRRRPRDRLRPALDPRHLPLARPGRLRARTRARRRHAVAGPGRRRGRAPRDLRPRRLPDARHDRPRRRDRRRRRPPVARLRRAALVHRGGRRDERRRPRADHELPGGNVRDHHLHRQQAPGRGLQAHRLHPEQRAHRRRRSRASRSSTAAASTSAARCSRTGRSSRTRR